MTREEAKDYIIEWCPYDRQEEIIKALEQQPCDDMEEIREIMSCDADAETKCKMISNILTVKPHYFNEKKPCEDAISRQTLQTELENCEVVNVRDENDNFIEYYNADTVDSILRNLPSVTPQPKIGHWINDDGDNAICSCCNRLNHLYGTYCKHCGAKMEVEENG